MNLAPRYAAAPWTLLTLFLALGALASGCGASAAGDASGEAGSGGTMTGGSSSVVFGGSGGTAAATGGSAGTAGTVFATGGTAATTGGSAGTAGTVFATGGTVATGGTPVVAGGSPATQGSSGGVTATGGTGGSALATGGGAGTRPSGGSGGAQPGGGAAGSGGGALPTGGTAGTQAAAGNGGWPTTAGTGGTTAGPVLLPQEGNPALRWFERARTEWAESLADVVLSYQQSNGGWPKNLDYTSEGLGNGGNDLGTFDNGATVTECVYLAEIYQRTGDTKYRDAVRAAFDFILMAQYSSGGWPQFFPLKGGYADHVTFNDDAMAHVLTVLHQAVGQAPPFDSDLFSDGDLDEFRAAIAGGIDYVLEAQWRQDGTLTVWCAQHGATDHLPKAARAYELESLSGSESVGIVGFLMTQPQTPEIEASVRAAVGWYRSADTYLDGFSYDTDQCPDGNPIVAQAGSRIWYRFYNLNTNRGFFSDRDGGTYHDIMEISQERRCGYRWAGEWGEALISYADSVGY